jgi:Transcriptional regulator, AbiEi antitoxin
MEDARMDPERTVLDRAARQHGLVTRDQALAAGMSDDQVHRRVRGGRWAVQRRGVYRVTGAPSTEEQAVMAAVLAAGPAVVASHLTAARLWRLRLPEPEGIELTTPPGRRLRAEGVQQHRFTQLSADDVHRLRGIPVTSPARTLVDCSGRVGPDELGRVVDDALRRRLVRLPDLVRSHARVTSGRRPTAAMARVLEERAAGHDPGGSDRELQVLRTLVAAGLPAPVQQHPVTVGTRSFRLDLAYPQAMVAIEFDGWDAHGTFEAFHGDRERSRLLVAAGWRLVHVTARTTPADLVGAVRALVLQRAG